MWGYVRKALGYSEPQTSERVSAMRLMRLVPEIKENLKAGKLTLTSTLQLAYFARREKLSPEKTVSVMENIVGKSKREVEKVLLGLQTVAVPKPDSVKTLSPDSSRLAFDADEEFMQLMERIKQIKGNPALNLQELFKITMKEFVDRRKPKPPNPPRSKQIVLQRQAAPQKQTARYNKTGLRPAEVSASFLKTVKLTSPKANSAYISPYISVAARAAVRERSKDRCEYIFPLTNHRCESRSALQFDHVHPRALGGKSEFQNIRHFCRTHNLLAASQIFGVEKMRPFLRP